jgi:ABC-2 type transport system permease protein
VIALVMAELLKLRTTRMVYGLLGALLLIVAIAAVAIIVDTPAAELASDEDQAGLFGTAATGIIFVLLLGVMLMSGEFRHGTITQTLLVTPNRWKVLAAKLIGGAVLGFSFGLIAELFSLALGVPLLALKGVDPAFGSESVEFVVATLLATTMCGMLGVALGSVIRNQVVAIVVVFATLLIVEQILTAATESRWPEVQKYFPGHAIAAVVSDEDDETLFSREGGLAVLAGYVIVLSGVGGRFVFSRDVNSIQA